MALKVIFSAYGLKRRLSRFLTQTDNRSRCFLSGSARISLDMNTVYFQNESGEDRLHVQLHVQNDEFHINKFLQFDRRMSETIDKFITRLDWKLQSFIEKKRSKIKKKKENEEVGELPDASGNVFENNSSFLFNDEPLAQDAIFEDVLNKRHAGDLKLRILGSDYNVLLNYPSVSELSLPESLRIGCPVFPKTFATKCCTDFEMDWFKKAKNSKEWVHCGSDYSYTPVESDVSCELKVVCVPKNGNERGPSYAVVSSFPVVEFPEMCCIAKRHEHTKTETGPDEIRVVTYNILANLYTTTKEAKTTLFTYCDPKYLSADYRTGLLHAELAGYKADLICLQEVDKKQYKNNLQPFLRSRGYSGSFYEKEGLREGCAFFYATDKFRLAGSRQFVYQEELLENPEFADWRRELEKNPKLMSRLTGLQTQIQVSTVECRRRPDDVVVVGNTHLYFHPNADHIRLLQGLLGFRLLQQTAESIKKENPEKNVSMIFCGDFNSSPDSGIYKLMTQGSISETETDWKSFPEEEIKSISFSHRLPMASACGVPRYTNYTEMFKDCLDYIYYQTERLEAVRFVPLPEEEDLKRQVAIPSAYFPSDHVALVADLRWKP